MKPVRVIQGQAGFCLIHVRLGRRRDDLFLPPAVRDAPGAEVDAPADELFDIRRAVPGDPGAATSADGHAGRSGHRVPVHAHPLLGQPALSIPAGSIDLIIQEFLVAVPGHPNGTIPPGCDLGLAIIGGRIDVVAADPLWLRPRRTVPEGGIDLVVIAIKAHPGQPQTALRGGGQHRLSIGCRIPSRDRDRRGPGAPGPVT